MTVRQEPHELPKAAVLVIIPTYNEKDNLPSIVHRLHAALPAAGVLIVDDASPDGTGELADALAADDERVHVLHRAGKSGLGAAYVAGFEWGLDGGYEFLVEMDADGSHDPADLPRMIATLQTTGADVVLGSRYVPGGRVLNWPWHRQWLSRGANLYSKMILGTSINDVTAGFRVYRSAVLAGMELRQVASRGYCFQVDLTLRSSDAGYRVVEEPITFTERTVGKSKMDREVVVEALWRLTEWGARRRSRQARALWSKRASSTPD